MKTTNKILELGSHYVSDFIKSESDYKGRNKYSLDLQLEESTGAVRLIEDAPNETMWGKYWYRSGINATMTKELGNIVTEICSRIKYKQGDIWLDIACNDGTMMKQIPNEFIKLGIDPCDDTFYNESCKYGTVIQDYFSYDAYQRTGYGDKKAKVITTIAMFYDLADPKTFINDVNKILSEIQTFLNNSISKSGKINKRLIDLIKTNKVGDKDKLTFFNEFIENRHDCNKINDDICISYGEGDDRCKIMFIKLNDIEFINDLTIHAPSSLFEILYNNKTTTEKTIKKYQDLNKSQNNSEGFINQQYMMYFVLIIIIIKIII